MVMEIYMYRKGTKFRGGLIFVFFEDSPLTAKSYHNSYCVWIESICSFSGTVQHLVFYSHPDIFIDMVAPDSR